MVQNINRSPYPTSLNQEQAPSSNYQSTFDSPSAYSNLNRNDNYNYPVHSENVPPPRYEDLSIHNKTSTSISSDPPVPSKLYYFWETIK